jgi:HSF-type DNA-binding
MKASLVSSSSWKSWQGVVSEDSSSEELDPDDFQFVDRRSSAAATRRKRTHRSNLCTSIVPPATRRRTSSASSSCAEVAPSIARGGVACPFPWKLHDMLDLCSGESDPLVTWNPDGTAFCVLNAKAFVQTILPRYVPKFANAHRV